MGGKKMFFGGSKVPLLEIGGVGYVIDTPFKLASYFTFGESDILSFSIDSGNVTAVLKVETFKGGLMAFKDNTSLTYFKFNKSFIFSKELFMGCSNLVLYEVKESVINDPNGDRVFYNCINLEWNNIKTKFDMSSNVIRCGEYFRNTKATAGTLDFSNVIAIDANYGKRFFFAGSTEANTINKIVDFRNLTSLDTSYTGSQAFIFQSFNGRILFWSLTAIGSDPNFDYRLFGQVSTVMVIEINIAMKTINAGSPHADLVSAISYGATVIYTDTSGNVIP